MKQVEIFVLGKRPTNQKGETVDGTVWTYYLNYKRAVIKRCGYIEESMSAPRASLIALYNALGQMREPCEIIVHSKMALGFKVPKKSHNKDLILKIMSTINKAGHVITFDNSDDFGRVEVWEEMYGKHKTKTVVPDTKGSKTPNEVFEATEKEEKELELQSKNWREMYSDLMSESHDAWVPGSGGY